VDQQADLGAVERERQVDEDDQADERRDDATFLDRRVADQERAAEARRRGRSRLWEAIRPEKASASPLSSFWGELNVVRADRQARKAGAGQRLASSFAALAPSPPCHYKAGGAGDGAVGV
jgi:hypothetical protein